MTRLHSILTALALGTVPVVGAFTCALEWQVITDEQQLAVQAGTVLTEVARPCKGPKGPDACGTLAEINKSVIDIGDIAKTAEIQVNQTATLVGQYGKVLNGIAMDIHGEMAEAKKATAAATVTLNGATKVLSTADDTVLNLQPVEGNAVAVLSDLDRKINSPTITATLDNFQATMKNVEGMTASGDRITFTLDQLIQKETKPILHPSKNRWVRTGTAIKPYLPLTVKTLGCYFVPGSCL